MRFGPSNNLHVHHCAEMRWTLSATAVAAAAPVPAALVALPTVIAAAANEAFPLMQTKTTITTTNKKIISRQIRHYFQTL